MTDINTDKLFNLNYDILILIKKYADENLYAASIAVGMPIEAMEKIKNKDLLEIKEIAQGFAEKGLLAGSSNLSPFLKATVLEKADIVAQSLFKTTSKNYELISS